ncbi:MAG TPA: 30S ribosomal protein S6 [Candidatus Lambdaproteobacteria bacterium]|nr:30S ribosomal protein S6 [SAR324 cluster bacterium]HBL56458.1 30S ribosomal protein S6 [Deltaproteobacteria bacterium]HIA58023.1 30S ribosomal protein S6 [Candidatus Lambdaproteobacteria bacterium]HIB45684.1 30S ribosomal protein S6 [Candidatus Lambdaproteobacteria bacterium]HIB93749.1 30S ribosomal protein S6 [Candidatus Lambdaproteobacteria bacterium]
MTGYELVFITTPTLNEEDLTVVLKKFKKSLTESGGKLIHEYVWGRRRLAYEIEGNDFGVYHAWYFTGSGKTVDELQRQFGYSDDILRNQIVKTDDLDEEAAFLHNLIPPKEETTEKEEDQEISAEIKQEAEIVADAETESEKTETESEVNKEELAGDAEEVKTETVDA